MKYLFILFFTNLLINMQAQVQKTFLYEISLYESFRHSSSWSEKEHQIQKEHINYLDSLTKENKLQIAGIVEQGLEGHTGLILLTTNSYEEAQEIALNDPSVKKGMMSARIRPVTIYFRKE